MKKLIFLFFAFCSLLSFAQVSTSTNGVGGWDQFITSSTGTGGTGGTKLNKARIYLTDGNGEQASLEKSAGQFNWYATVPIGFVSTSIFPPGNMEFRYPNQFGDGNVYLAANNNGAGKGFWFTNSGESLNYLALTTNYNYSYNPWYMGSTAFLSVANVPNGTAGDPVLAMNPTTGQIEKSVAVVTSGSYTPTLTKTTNLTTLTLTQATYSRNGNIVHVNVSGTYLPTSASTANFLITVSLPVNTSVGAQTDVGRGDMYNVNQGGALGKVDINSASTATVLSQGNNVATEKFSIWFDYTL